MDRFSSAVDMMQMCMHCCCMCKAFSASVSDKLSASKMLLRAAV